MPKELSFIDLHCHPNYKPFGRAHIAFRQPPVAQPDSPVNPASLWFYDPPTPLDKLFNYAGGLCRFRQSALSAAHYGNVRIMAAGLGSVERGFFRTKIGTKWPADAVKNFVSGFGKPRIDTIQGMGNYWQDFLQEIQFLKEGAGKVVRFDGQYFTYLIPANTEALLEQQAANQNPKAGQSKDHPFVTSIIISTEGLHILNCGLEQPCHPSEVLANVRTLKTMEYRPWFVTFAHHFYNELCGHARSLREIVGALTDQEKGIGTGLTPLGEQVIAELLDNTAGNRVLIDVKHMSPAARYAYYTILQNNFNKDKSAPQVPVFMSHGVANALPTYGATVSRYPEFGKKFIRYPLGYIEKKGRKLPGDHNEINFYDDELILMAQTGGIIGLQLDERRVANDETLKEVKNALWRGKIMHERSKLLWNQIQYIAELLDQNNLYAWGNMGIGSDYDGLVDPLNSFWTMEEFPDLLQYIERHAYRYFRDQPERLRNSFNRVDAETVVQQIFHRNALDFFNRWF